MESPLWWVTYKRLSMEREMPNEHKNPWLVQGLGAGHN